MNTLFVVIGHSGSGKTTIMRQLMDNEIISLTTRPIRDYEVHGRDYYFITNGHFKELHKTGGLIEYSEYAGNHYGISSEEFYGKLSKGNAFSIVDIHGYERFKDFHPNIVSIFLYTTRDEAIENLIRRGENQETITKRLNPVRYAEELENKSLCDYVIRNKNGHLDETIKIVQTILEIEK